MARSGCNTRDSRSSSRTSRCERLSIDRSGKAVQVLCQGKKGDSMKKIFLAVSIANIAMGSSAAFAQIKQTREQMMFYTSDWKGERFPDGRPKVAENLLQRALGVSIEDVWDYVRSQGYTNQFEGGWQALHIEKPFAGRALTAQFMPRRPDMAAAVAAEGKAEGRVSNNNSWPIAELQSDDVYVADGFGKIIDGTLIGSNLGNAIAG